MNNFENLPRNRVVVVVDGEGLCWNSTYFAHRKFPTVDSVEERYSTILWCIFERIRKASEKFKTNKFIFAWDSPDNKAKRKEIFPAYKANREKRKNVEILPTDNARTRMFKQKAIEQEAQIKEARPMWGLLREEILPKMGFVNQLMVDGYEGDDIIAYITKNAGRTPMVMYSEDADLYQCITPTVCQMSVRIRRLKSDGTIPVPSVLDRQRFMLHFGITPEQWSEFKAIAGCPSDSVPGVAGVGKATTLRYLKEGKLLLKSGKPSTKQLAIELAEKNGQLAIFRKLVTIPYEGFPGVTLKPFEANKRGFVEVCQKYHLSGLFAEPFWEEFFD